MKKTMYEVNGVEVSTLKEVAELLEVANVSGKEVKEGKYPEVKIVEVEIEEVIEEIEEPTEEELQATILDEEVILDEPTEELDAEVSSLVKDLEVEMPKTALELVQEDMAKNQVALEETSTVEEVEEVKEEVIEEPVVEEAKEEVVEEAKEEVVEEPVVVVEEPVVVEDTAIPEEVVEEVKEEVVEEPVVVKEAKEEVVAKKEHKYPAVGYFESEKDMKKYIKKLTDAELEEWCNLEGVTWKPNDHLPINRMRMAMAIKVPHGYGTLPKGTATKKKSKYADYTTEDLVQMAIDNDVEVPDDKGDLRILRMYTIMSLRKAGLIE